MTRIDKFLSTLNKQEKIDWIIALEKNLKSYKDDQYNPVFCPLCILAKECRFCLWTFFVSKKILNINDPPCVNYMKKHFTSINFANKKWIALRIKEIPKWIERIKCSKNN